MIKNQKQGVLLLLLLFSQEIEKNVPPTVKRARSVLDKRILPMLKTVFLEQAMQ